MTQRKSTGTTHEAFCSTLDSTAVVAERSPSFAVLPVGAVEQHGPHLPLLTDALVAEHIAEGIARKLGGLLLPVLSYGTSPEHRGFHGTISLRSGTLHAVVSDISEQCFDHGIPVVVMLSGHGGNFILVPAVRELNATHNPAYRAVLVPEAVLFGDVMADAASPDDFHAGGWETSNILALEETRGGSLVDRQRMVDFVPEGVPRWDISNRTFQEITESGVWGYPSRGTAASGWSFLDAAIERVSEYVARQIGREKRQERD